MSDLENRVIALEEQNEKLILELRAAKLAISVLSNVVEVGFHQEKGLMAKAIAPSNMSFREELSPEEKKRFDEINQKVQELLGLSDPMKD